jgi:hypothetical protein
MIEDLWPSFVRRQIFFRTIPPHEMAQESHLF